MAMSGADHYARAEELLAHVEPEASPNPELSSPLVRETHGARRGRARRTRGGHCHRAPFSANSGWDPEEFGYRGRLNLNMRKARTKPGPPVLVRSANDDGCLRLDGDPACVAAGQQQRDLPDPRMDAQHVDGT